jgi:hypothetical protein
MTVEADPGTVQNVTVLRGVLDAMLERSVFGQLAVRQPDRVVRALRRVRTAVLIKVRLLHLVDKDDCGTDSDPPGRLRQTGRSEGGTPAVHSAASVGVGVLRAVGQILQFVSALQEQLLKSIEAGVGWKELSTYYCKVMRHVDQKAAGFAGQAGKQEPPDARWAKEPMFEWVAELHGENTLSRISAEMRRVHDPPVCHQYDTDRSKL